MIFENQIKTKKQVNKVIFFIVATRSKEKKEKKDIKGPGHA